MKGKDNDMGKLVVANEVHILAFFESGPLDKAEVLFNIIEQKMRERLRRTNGDDAPTPRASPKKRGTTTEAGAAAGPSSEHA